MPLSYCFLSSLSSYLIVISTHSINKRRNRFQPLPMRAVVRAWGGGHPVCNGSGRAPTSAASGHRTETNACCQQAGWLYPRLMDKSREKYTYDEFSFVEWAISFHIANFIEVRSHPPAKNLDLPSGKPRFLRLPRKRKERGCLSSSYR